MAAGAGSFNITVTEILHPLGLVPTVSGTTEQWYNLGGFSAACSNGQVQRSVFYPPPIYPVVLAPTLDPLYDRTLTSALLKPQSYDLNPNQLSIFVVLGTDLLNSQIPALSDPSACGFNFSMFVHADGSPISASPIYFTEDPRNDCNSTQLQQFAADHQALVKNFTSPLDLFVAVMAISTDTGVGSSILWSRCKRAADQFVISNQFVTVNSTVCYASPGTEEYYSDPCCNPSQTWQQCCIPRAVATRVLTPSDASLTSECATPDCSSQVASTYAEVSSRSLTAQCSVEAFRGLATNSDILGSALIGNQAGPCNEVFMSGSDDDLVTCILATLDELYVQEFLTLWGISNDQLQAYPGGFEALLRSKYNVSDGCVQLGVDPYDVLLRVPIRNDALDTNATACLSTPDCNWRGQADPYTCSASFRGSDMCAFCQAGYCQSATVPQICYGLNVVSALYPAIVLCVINGGTPDPELGCYYQNRSAQLTDCLPANICPGGANTCPPTCHWTAITQQSTCETDPNRVWLSTGTCVQYSILYEDCVAQGGDFFLGATFQQGFLNDQASCDYFGGVCTIAPGLNFTECMAYAALPRGTCSVYCPGCTQAQCEATVGCADGGLFETPSSSPTCVGDFFSYGSNIATCGQGALMVPSLGCVFNENYISIDSTFICAVLGGTLIDAPTITNRTVCESFGRCQESNFVNGITTPKSSAQCGACGGTFLTAFQWTNGTWTPDPTPAFAAWVPLAWTPRTYAPRYFLGTFFNRTGFAADFYTIQTLRILRFANQTSLCRSAQLLDLVSSLACDCTSSSTGACYTTPQFQLLLLERVCSNVSSILTFNGKPGSVSVSTLARLTPSCVDLELSVVPVELFKRSDDQVYSSVFLQTLAGGPYDVLQNSRKIIVGTLVGDGVRITVGNGIISGPIQLCLDRELSSSKRFSVPDLATISTDLDPKTLRSLGANCSIANNTICCDISTSMGNIFFPIMRVRNTADERLLDTLTTTQRNCFWAAAAIYLFLWLLVTYRLVNFVLFLIIRPGKIEWSNLALLGIITCLLFIASVLRWTYFIVTPLGRLVDSPQLGDLVYAELPFYVYLSMFTVLVAWWIEIYHFAMSAKKAFLRNARWILIGVNVAMYCFFLAVIIAYAAASSGRTSSLKSVCVSPDSGSKSSRAASVLSKVYKVFISVIAAILAFGFLIYGGILVRVLTSGNNVNLRSLINFSVIGATCAVGLLVECGVLLYTTFASQTNLNTAAALVVLILAEVIPGLALVVILKQPTTQHGWREYCWCLFSPEASSTTSASNSQYTRSAPSSGTSERASSGVSSSGVSGSGEANDSRF